MNEGTWITQIYDYSHNGAGVGKLDGKTVFVPHALRGETVRFRIVQEKRDYLQGEMVEILAPAPWRVSPPCPSYPDCGGCQLQHMDYEEQLYFKRKRVVAALRRIGGLENPPVNPALGMEHPWRYRHTARLHVSREADKTALGYYQGKTHVVEEIADCLLLPSDCSLLLKALSELLNHRGDTLGKGLKEVVLRKGYATGEFLVLFHLEELPLQTEFPGLEEITAAFPALVGLLGQTPHAQAVFSGRDYYTEVVSGLRLRVPASAFFQNNPLQTVTLVETVKSFCEPRPGGVLLDLYCGVGLFSLALAPRYGQVYGIEENRDAAAAACANAQINKIENVKFICGRVEDVLPLLKKKGVAPHTAILDPPRGGCSGRALKEIGELAPERIVYVSCNPATLARDLSLLGKRYQTLKVQPLDLFPQTSHIESVALLARET